jgi:uncharacterized protein YceK
MNIKIFLALGLVIFFSGCGTLNTVVYNDDSVIIDLKNGHTKCSSISRIYSGVVYDFCSLHAEPSPVLSRNIITDSIPFKFLDTLFSAVLDTAILPYTVYQQIDKGSIEVQ